VQILRRLSRPGAGVSPEAFEPFRRDDLARRLLPFAAAATLGALAPLGSAGAGVRHPALLVGSGLMALVAAAAMLLIPWGRLPAGLQLLPVLGYLATVVMLRAGASGSTLVFEPLPIFWLALYHPGRQLLAGVAVVFGIVLVSLLLQDTAPREWAAQVFWPVAGGFLGITFHQFVARVRQQRAELELLARTDPLTGCGNRRAWHEELDHHLALASRLGYQVTVAMLDLDRFKEWNDDHGHEAGDRLLQELVSAWEEVLREVDVLARLGGDEFAVLLPGAEPVEAEAAVERLRDVVPQPLSCSAGISSWSGGEPPREFMARADQALYMAKRAGRDRSVVLGPLQGARPLQVRD
jgi:diguanylate cyclase (GGDEF)-like protein